MERGTYIKLWNPLSWPLSTSSPPPATNLKPRICSSHLLRLARLMTWRRSRKSCILYQINLPESTLVLSNPCCNTCFTISLLNISMDMPASQNRSNYTFRYGFLRLATIPTAKSGLKTTFLFLTFAIFIISQKVLRNLTGPIMMFVIYSKSSKVSPWQ